MSPTRTIPPRSRVPVADTWDLTSLFADDDAWEQAFRSFRSSLRRFSAFRGKLGTSAKTLAQCLQFHCRVERRGERLGTYALLKSAEDQTNSTYQRMLGRYQNAATRAAEAASFLRPEILAIPARRMRGFLHAPEMKPYRRLVERILRYRPHTLGKKEEALLAMQGEMAEAASTAFRQLLDADLKFGLVKNEQGERVELTNANLTQFLLSPNRSVRQTAFHQYYRQFAAHQHTLAATLNGSIQKDVYEARARGYASSLAAALFPDSIPATLYDNLIAAVRRRLPTVHRYYEVRRRAMRLKEIHHYDTYVPLVGEFCVRRSWEEAVSLILSALEPLGSDYCGTLESGLRGRWCDRYANRGKHSGAFSCGSYDGDPYILMNYKPDVLDDVFTLAHEAGHSMHSYYSARHQPFPYYSYAIFVAEVASTFNEQLLSNYLLDRAADKRHRAYLINREIDAIRATLIRQTMFAEFEKTTHAMAEAGEPLTVQALKDVYRQLLKAYFGPRFTLDEDLSLECLRIPHFYRAFYVYKYATGLAAAIALSQRVLHGGPPALRDYLGFLRAGSSKYPLELLRDAGVDLESPEPIHAALSRLEHLVDELDAAV